MALEFTKKEKLKFLHHAELAGHWYCNNQNTNENPWGGIKDSADKGRYVYEYVLHKNMARGMGVWGQALAIMDLYDLAKRNQKEGWRFLHSVELAANYLKTLQVTDFRLPKSIGGFREHTPQTTQSYPRDAVTGGFGLCRLFKETKDEEWLDRAKLFAEWWIKYGTDAGGWPYITFDLVNQRSREGGMNVVGEDNAEKFIKGDWQAGSAIFFYQLYKLTKDERYIKKGFDPLIKGLARIYEENLGKPVVEGFHGHVPVSHGNDDFALVALICGYRLKKEKRLLELLAERIKQQNSLMDEDGSYPSLGGTFVSGINNMEFLKLVETEKLDIDVSEVERCVRKSAEFGLTLQVKEGADLRLLGGVWGQSDHDVARNTIHHRSIGYSINFYLRLEGGIEVPTLSSFGW
jgi:hypothetical protein